MHGAAGVGGGGTDLFVGSFKIRDGSGTQQVTGVGFTPKALLLWSSNRAKANSGTWAIDVQQVIGFTSGPSASYAISGASRDAKTSSETARAVAAKAFVGVDSSGTSSLAEADLDSFDADGFTLNWTTNLYGGAIDGPDVMFLAIGGDDVEAQVVNWTSPTSTGNKAVTGVGFEPGVVLHAPGAASTTIPTTSAGMIGVGLGAMDAAGNQWMNTLASADNATTSDTSRYQRTDKCVAYINDSGTVNEEAAFVSMDADGFTTNFTSANGVAVQYISLCLSGLDAKVGNFTKTTDAAPASQAVTGVGFEPGSVLLSSVGAASSTSIASTAAWALGGGDGSNERSVAQRDGDGLGTTEADSIWHNDKVFVQERTNSGGPTTDEEADLTSLDADGFTLNWTTNGGLPTEILYLALA